MKNITIKIVESGHAEEICHQLATSSNFHLKNNQVYFVAYQNNQPLSIMIVQAPYSHNAHIQSISFSNNHIIEKKLLSAVEHFCLEKKYSSLTIETHNNKDHAFFKESGFKPLFVINHETNLICLQKTISLDDYEFIDLTHSLSSDVPHWGTDIGFKYNARLIRNIETSSGVKFRVQRLEMSAGIGTHMDAPSHCFENENPIDKIKLQSLITTCRVIDVSSKAQDNYSVTEDDILSFENQHGLIPKNAFVIIYTGWDQRWEQADKYRNEKIFPSISIPATKLLLSRDIVGLGIDTLSPDVFGSDFPVHQLVLGANKYIIENVANAKALGASDSFIFALPIKIEDGTEAPMRLIGMKRKNF